jgi:hypothetical protein
MRYVFSYFDPRTGFTYETEPLNVEEAVSFFSETLDKGVTYENGKGKSKIDRNPKTVDSLIDKLNKASKNAAKGKLYTVYRAHNVL